MKLRYPKRGTPAFALLSCILLAHYGWLKFAGHGHAVYVMDWTLRLVILAVAWEALKPGMTPWYPVIRVRDWLIGLLCMYLMAKYAEFFVGVLAYEFFGIVTYVHFGYPLLPMGPMFMFDMTVGLLLVALSEEVVYRKLFVDLWREKGWRTWSIYLSSSFAFGLLHVNQGNMRLPETFLWGLFMMWIYRRTNSLPFIVLLHWIANVLMFGTDHIGPYTLESDFWCDLAIGCTRQEFFDEIMENYEQFDLSSPITDKDQP